MKNELADRITARVRDALRAVCLDGGTLHESFGEPRVIQVTRPSTTEGAAPVVVFSATIRGSEAPAPAPRQPTLFDAAAKTRAPASPAGPVAAVEPAAPSRVVPSAQSFAALGLVVVETDAPIATLRATVPHASWRPIGLDRWSAILGAADLAALRAVVAPGALREIPFAPDAAVGLVLEIDGEDPLHAELAAQLAAELAPGGRPSAMTRRAGTVTELPRSTDEARLAWAIAYLLDARAPWWIRTQAARKAPRKGRAS